ncbi:hypothetical protein [Nonomuraea sp. NPDC050783]
MELNIQALDMLPARTSNAPHGRARCCLSCLTASLIYVSSTVE